MTTTPKLCRERSRPDSRFGQTIPCARLAVQSGLCKFHLAVRARVEVNSQKRHALWDAEVHAARERQRKLAAFDDLLAAARTALKRLEYDKGDSDVRPEYISVVLDQLRAAIAKAEVKT